MLPKVATILYQRATSKNKSSNNFNVYEITGIGGDLAARRRAGGGYRDDSADTSNLVRPKLELGTVCDRAEEERKLKLILK